VAEPDDDERRDRNQRALAAAAGAALGSVIAGPVGGAVGAGLGPLLEPLVKGVWAELSESARQRETDVLFWAIHAGIPSDELEDRINASERTQLLTGYALSAAARTAWEDKLRTLGRSLASGLLADDNAKIDAEQMIIVAIADIEGPQLAMLELLVCWRPDLEFGSDMVDGPLDIPEDSQPAWPEYATPDPTWGGSWHVNARRLGIRHIAYARPNLAPIAPGLLATLERHGLVWQNDNTIEAIRWYSEDTENEPGEQYSRYSASNVSNRRRAAPKPTWSPTELGEQVFLRFRDAGTKLPDVWASGPAEQQE
jgi:hypothetical protein